VKHSDGIRINEGVAGAAPPVSRHRCPPRGWQVGLGEAVTRVARASQVNVQGATSPSAPPPLRLHVGRTDPRVVTHLRCCMVEHSVITCPSVSQRQPLKLRASMGVARFSDLGLGVGGVWGDWAGSFGAWAAAGQAGSNKAPLPLVELITHTIL
jgi:hypothetical protein